MSVLPVGVRALGHCRLGVSGGLGKGGHVCDMCNEPIAAARDGFDVSRLGSIVIQHFSQAVHCLVERLIEIDEGIARPYPVPELLTSDDLTRPIYESRENPKGLLLKPDSQPILSQFHAGYV